MLSVSMGIICTTCAVLLIGDVYVLWVRDGMSVPGATIWATSSVPSPVLPSASNPVSNSHGCDGIKRISWCTSDIASGLVCHTERRSRLLCP
jgi:hypothetical protein